MKRLLWLVLLFACVSPVVFSEESPCRYLAGMTGGDASLRLVDNPSAPVKIREFGDRKVVGPAQSHDYYSRARLSFAVHDPSLTGAKEVTAVVEYVDEGFGLIGMGYDGGRGNHDDRASDDPTEAGAAALAGYTFMDTGKVRHAAFLLTTPMFRHAQAGGADLYLEGVTALVGLTLIPGRDDGAVEQARKEIPAKTEPKFALKRPMQLVTTVGAHAGKRKDIAETQARMRELCPLMHALGFNGVESYVAWGHVEQNKGEYDWSFFDAVVSEADKYGMKWFPLLIGGSAYALPAWYHDSAENVGFMCLEHHKSNNIQTIFCENQTPYVQAFLKAFGRHYEPMDVLLGVRLGASGNFGESQYPAAGNWGYDNKPEHIHVGWWAGDPHAAAAFRGAMKQKYTDIAALSKAWQEEYKAFDEVTPFVPQFAENERKRKDLVDWYMGAMTLWCERWAQWTREALPKTPVYQSSGGWGFVESGTDFTDQTESMAKVSGGIRATNETDSYAQNFYATRMLSSAARFYGVPFGSEPAGFGSARAIAARTYNILVNNGQHLFFYESNLLTNDQATAKWLEVGPLLDRRAEPVIDVAVLYPDTESKLDDAVFRNLYAFPFGERVAALRPKLDFDFCSERMVLDGALPRYKALVLMWNYRIEAETLNRIDQWVRDGGTVIVQYWNRRPVGSVEGDYSVFNRWLRGETGKGKALIVQDDRVPAHRYTDFVYRQLLGMDTLDPMTKRMLRTEKPDEVYVSALKGGQFAVLNYNDTEVTVTVPELPPAKVAPYGIAVLP